MTVKITPNDRGNPPGKLADAEVHFTDGPLEGLKLIGFSVWEQKRGAGRNVTFPAFERTVAEMHFHVRELSGRVASVVRGDLDRHDVSPSATSPSFWTRDVRFLHPQEEPPRGPGERPRASAPRRRGMGVTRVLREAGVARP